MNEPQYEMCHQCRKRVRVVRTTEDFGAAAQSDTGHVLVDVLQCARGHRFLRPGDDGLAPDQA